MIEIDFVPKQGNAICREKGPDCEGKRGTPWRKGSNMLRIRGWAAGGTAIFCVCEKCIPAVLDRFKVASRQAKKAAKKGTKK